MFYARRHTVYVTFTVGQGRNWEDEHSVYLRQRGAMLSWQWNKDSVCNQMIDLSAYGGNLGWEVNPILF